MANWRLNTAVIFIKSTSTVYNSILVQPDQFVNSARLVFSLRLCGLFGLYRVLYHVQANKLTIYPKLNRHHIYATWRHFPVFSE